jgi:hypothetical protein
MFQLFRLREAVGFAGGLPKNFAGRRRKIRAPPHGF